MKKVLIVNKSTSETKIKSYEGKINTDFYDNEIPEEGSHCMSVCNTN